MDTSSSESVIPVTRNNDEEGPAMPKKDPPAAELQVARDMFLLAQTPSATTRGGTQLPLRRSPSPVADHRISQWKNEKRAFKGTITRITKDPGAIKVARVAQKSALMLGGQPQFVMFCDGSSGFKSGQEATKDGGYAVVFRDPYDANIAATASASESATTTFIGPRQEDGITIGDFTIRHWLSHRTFGNSHTEIAALSQALEEVTKRIDQHQPDKSIVKIFTDFDGSLSRLQKGILTFETTTAANSLKRKRNLTKKEQANTSFFAEHTNPFVQALVWQSHYLSDRGCTIEINWMPRNTTLGHRLADYMAGQWRWEDPGDAFNQKFLPHNQRDGILDKLHRDVGSIERERAHDTLGFQKLQKEKRKIKRATGAKRRSTRDLIALLDSPSDYIPLDSESDHELATPPPSQKKRKNKKQKIKGALKDQKRSTEDHILLDSDSEKEHEPRLQSPEKKKMMITGPTPTKETALDSSSSHVALDSKAEEQSKPKQEQPPKIKKEIQGPTAAKQRSTSDFVFLDSDSEEEPQQPKKRRRIRRARGKKSSARDHIAIDNPSVHIAINFESEEQPEPKRSQHPNKKQKTNVAIMAKQGGTSNQVPLSSDSEQKLKPKPHPPEKQEIKGATTVKERSTSDFIVLDSDAKKQPEAKRPQTPKKRKKVRGAIPAKKKKPQEQHQAGPGATGFLNGEHHAFTFASGNLPRFPTPKQEHAIHDPESGHGTPGCLLCDCKDDEYPWRSGYTGLPSQWALRRY